MPEQTAYLRAAVDIGHLGARVEDEGALLEAAADLFQRSFDLVAVQVYLVDGPGLFGELRHHAGAGDRKAIARTPGVPVGSGSELGEVLAGGEARLVRDLTGLPRSAVPPEARRGVALPLVVEGQTSGALLLYAEDKGSFAVDAPDISPFVALADILALALESVRARAEARLESGHPQREAGEAGRLQRLPPVEKPIVYTAGPEGESRGGELHTAPITLRGSVIGSMSFRDSEERKLAPDDTELIESVAEQVAQAIENLELLEGTERIARREQLINEITAQLQRATSVDDVLKTAAQAVRVALGNVEVTARLEPGAMAAPAESESPADAQDADEGEETK